MDKMNNNQTSKDTMGQQKKSGLADRIGDAVEKVGTTIGKTAPGIGKKIHDAGDSIEKNHGNPNHRNDRTN